MSTLSGVLGLVCRLEVYTGPGRKFMSDYAIDFAWVPMTTFVLLGVAMPMWRSTCLPRLVVQLGVLGLTMLELYLELAQRGDGAAPYFDQPSGWPQVMSNWLHEHQGNVFSWGDMLAFGLAGALTYLALERSGMCAAVGSPVNRRLMPRGRVARTAVIMLLLPAVMLPTMAFEQKIGGNAADNARADTGGGLSGAEALQDCLDDLKKPHEKALDKAKRNLKAAQKDGSTSRAARARKSISRAKAKIADVNAQGREARTDLPDVPKALSQCVFKKVSVSRFGSRHWSDHEKLIVQESSWRANAIGQPTSKGKACGIPQALPCKKMGDKSLPGQADWQMDYIAERYGNPSKAWAHEVSYNWY